VAGRGGAAALPAGAGVAPVARPLRLGRQGWAAGRAAAGGGGGAWAGPAATGCGRPPTAGPGSRPHQSPSGGSCWRGRTTTTTTCSPAPGSWPSCGPSSPASPACSAEPARFALGGPGEEPNQTVPPPDAVDAEEQPCERTRPRQP